MEPHWTVDEESEIEPYIYIERSAPPESGLTTFFLRSGGDLMVAMRCSDNIRPLPPRLAGPTSLWPSSVDSIVVSRGDIGAVRWVDGCDNGENAEIPVPEHERAGLIALLLGQGITFTFWEGE